MKINNVVIATTRKLGKGKHGVYFGKEGLKNIIENIDRKNVAFSVLDINTQDELGTATVELKGNRIFAHIDLNDKIASEYIARHPIISLKDCIGKNSCIIKAVLSHIYLGTNPCWDKNVVALENYVDVNPKDDKKTSELKTKVDGKDKKSKKEKKAKDKKPEKEEKKQEAYIVTAKLLQIDVADESGDIFSEACVNNFKKQIPLKVVNEFNEEDEIGIVSDIELKGNYIEGKIVLTKPIEGYPAIAGSIDPDEETFKKENPNHKGPRNIDDIIISGISINEEPNIDKSIPKIIFKSFDEPK